MDILADSKVCHGCSRHSMRTHRCSRCREARYCSQDCHNQDWKEHRVRCRDFTRPGIEELYITKKVEGEARKIYAENCFKILCGYNPSLVTSQVATKQKNEEVD